VIVLSPPSMHHAIWPITCVLVWECRVDVDDIVQPTLAEVEASDVAEVL
jgi:hypothetical protein